MSYACRDVRTVSCRVVVPACCVSSRVVTSLGLTSSVMPCIVMSCHWGLSSRVI